jgi:hypothetical protein
MAISGIKVMLESRNHGPIKMDTFRLNPTRRVALPSIEIDSALIAPGLGLDPVEFQRLLDTGKIRVLCERGTGEDAGSYRASFYLDDRRVRLLLDASGQLLQDPEVRDTAKGKQNR